MAEKSLEFQNVVVCRDPEGKVSLLTQSAVKGKVKEGSGLAISVQMEGEELTRNVVYAGCLVFSWPNL